MDELNFWFTPFRSFPCHLLLRRTQRSPKIIISCRKKRPFRKIITHQRPLKFKHLFSWKLSYCCWYCFSLSFTPLLLHHFRRKLQKRTLSLNQILQNHFRTTRIQKILSLSPHGQKRLVCRHQRRIIKIRIKTQKRKITTQKRRKKSRKKSRSSPPKSQKSLGRITPLTLQLVRLQNFHCQRKRQIKRSRRILEIIRPLRLLHLAH